MKILLLLFFAIGIAISVTNCKPEKKREHVVVHSYKVQKQLDDKRVIDYLHHRGIDCVIISEIGEHDQFDTYAMLNPKSIEIIGVIDLGKEKLK